MQDLIQTTLLAATSVSSVAGLFVSLTAKAEREHARAERERILTALEHLRGEIMERVSDDFVRKDFCQERHDKET